MGVIANKCVKKLKMLEGKTKYNAHLVARGYKQIQGYKQMQEKFSIDGDVSRVEHKFWILY